MSDRQANNGSSRESNGTYFILCKYARRLLKSEFFYPLFFFIFMQIIFLCLFNFDFIPPIFLQLGPSPLNTAFFLLSVNVLLFFNTWIFSASTNETFSALCRSKEISAGEAARAKHDMRTFSMFMHAATIISSFSAIFILLALCNPEIFYWWLVVDICKFITIVVFVLFVFGDLCCLDVVSRILPKLSTDDPLKPEALVMKNAISRYIFAVDVPGLAGAVVLVAFSMFIKPAGVQLSYWEGFTAGAIGLHVVFSQFALFFLSALDDEG